MHRTQKRQVIDSVLLALPSSMQLAGGHVDVTTRVAEQARYIDVRIEVRKDDLIGFQVERIWDEDSDEMTVHRLREIVCEAWIAALSDALATLNDQDVFAAFEYGPKEVA
jgi:hypothetical protein